MDNASLNVIPVTEYDPFEVGSHYTCIKLKSCPYKTTRDSVASGK